MSITELRRILKREQARLGLQNWNIAIRWARKAESEGVSGSVSWNAEEQCAEICLQRGQADYRATLVHELLHIRIDGHAPMGYEYNIQREVGINWIARALTE